MSTLSESQRDTLVADLKNVIHDAEELLKLTASDVSTEATELRARVGRRLQQARDGLLDLQESAVARARAAGRKTDEYVHDHPWQSVGVGMAVGLLVGLLIGRR